MSPPSKGKKGVKEGRQSKINRRSIIKIELEELSMNGKRCGSRSTRHSFLIPSTRIDWTSLLAPSFGGQHVRNLRRNPRFCESVSLNTTESKPGPPSWRRSLPKPPFCQASLCRYNSSVVNYNIVMNELITLDVTNPAWGWLHRMASALGWTEMESIQDWRYSTHGPI